MAKLAVIVGPTACGKTALSIAAAKKLDAEIVSADSVQLYQRLDIGSAKPTEAEKDGVPHHMLDCVPPETPVTAAQYQRMAFECIDTIVARKKLPLIVGGTGLYINALTTSMDFTESDCDEELRKQLAAMEREQPGCLHETLKTFDEKTAQRLHPNDEKRLIRAIEVYKTTGRTMAEYMEANKAKPPRHAAVMIGLTMPRELLYERIERRVDIMFETGLENEVRALLQSGLDPSLASLQGLGYKEVIAYIHGECTLEQAVAIIKQNTRRFAKRQWTWFKRDERITWLDVTQYSKDELTEKACALLSQAAR